MLVLLLVLAVQRQGRQRDFFRVHANIQAVPLANACVTMNVDRIINAADCSNRDDDQDI